MKTLLLSLTFVLAWIGPAAAEPLRFATFHSRHCESRRVEVIAGGGSDHSPCVAELVWAKEGK